MTPNPAQESAIKGSASLKVVIAGPGSGKTFTLTEAVKWRAGTDIIAVMTFTNGAAYELRQRLGDISDRLAFIGTTHSYCFKLIQRFGALIGYKSGQVAILPDSERIPRLLAVRDKLGIKISEKELLHPTVGSHSITRDRMLLVHEYEFVLKQNNLVDFDGILRDGAELLQRDEVRDQAKIDWLFVDERQDSSQEDQKIYDLIPAAHKFYVGDVDQCIYGFRGADPGGFVDLALDASHAQFGEVIQLECNYRSDIAICRAANELIAHNKMRVNKKIMPVSQESGVVGVASFESQWQELTHIEKVTRARVSHMTIAVLCRTNFEATRIYNFLYGQGLPVVRQRYVQHPPDWQRAILLLSLAASPDNEILIERYLKLDNPPGIVDQWLLESRAGGTAFASRVQHVLAATLHKAPRYLAENGVGEITIGLIKQHSDALPPDATLMDLLQDLAANEETQLEREEGEGIYVGTMHCSPGDEEVLTTRGYRRIDSISSSDRLFSFNGRCNTLCRGKNAPRGHTGYKAVLKSRFYSGPMLKLMTEESCTRVTPEHRVRTRFTDQFYDKWIVYLMRRGGWWRVGMCTSAKKPYVSGGLGGRLASEKADDGWILGVYAQRQSAIEAEYIYQTRYGIPSLRFESGHESRFTSGELHAIHNRLREYVEPNVSRLAHDLGILLNEPLYSRKRQRVAHASAWFETVAANLISYYMALPVANEIDWKKKSPTRPRSSPVVVSTAHYSGRVFSLDVPPYGFYVSGGAIVHNSAKGREFDVVFLPAFEDGTIPHTVSHPDYGDATLRRELEEERRLAFVAVTRAKHELYISWAAARQMQWGSTKEMKPSRFIAEMGL